MLTVENRTIELFPSARPGAPLVVINTVTGEGEAVWAAVRGVTDANCSLAAVGGLDWERDLTPWPAPSLGGSGGLCGGGADDYIGQLTGRLLPEILARLGGAPAWLGLAGYSLGGLFALYAPYVADAFARIASASGSLWYPGFVEYAMGREMRRRPERVYLSLGDREGRARNPALRPVERNTRRLADEYAAMGICSLFELNPGGHFKDENRRLARAVAWLLEERSEAD